MKVDKIQKTFRGVLSTKKEMELRLAFLKDVQKMDFDTTGIEASVLGHYEQLQSQLELAEQMLELLEPHERTVLFARYFRGVRWEYMEAETMYSTSQCQRIHNRALKKLTHLSLLSRTPTTNPIPAGI